MQPMLSWQTVQLAIRYQLHRRRRYQCIWVVMHIKIFDDVKVRESGYKWGGGLHVHVAGGDHHNQWGGGEGPRLSIGGHAILKYY